MKLDRIENINYLWSSLIVEELVRLGIDYFCIAPGSRCAPLTMAAARHDKAGTIVHFDERGLAFHALGHTAATKKPGIVITTSGTAVANLFPAVVEASKKKLPMIILTGDRPPELRHTGANQTIDQVNIFGTYTRWFFDLPAPSSEIDPAFVLTTIDQAVYRARGEWSGPVHINCMFREPLDPKVEKFPIIRTRAFDRWIGSGKPLTQYARPVHTVGDSSLDDLARRIQKNPNGIIAVGKLRSGEEKQAVLSLAEKLRWPVFPDVTSGLRLESSNDHVIHYFDRILVNSKKGLPAIEGVIHVGGRMTSKAYYQTVEQLDLKYYCMVLNHPLRNDPTHQVTHRLQLTAELFAEKTLSLALKTKEPPYLKTWQDYNRRIDRIIDKKVFSRPVNEYGVVRLVSKLIPEKSGLFLSNSLPIREMDSFGSPSTKGLLISANRGASGIDGNLGTVSGLSTGWRTPVTAILGDLACLHDLNSLSLIRQARYPVVLIVLNNRGGGIFSLLPIARENNYLDRYFTASHDYSFSSAADQFGLKYANVSDFDDFAVIYKLALRGRKAAIIEITTDRDEIVRLSEGINRAIRKILT